MGEEGTQPGCECGPPGCARFFELVAEAEIRPEFQEYDQEVANQAMAEMKQGKIRGAKVLRIN